jgi:DNA-binding FadR family transcriptional regulator
MLDSPIPEQASGGDRASDHVGRRIADLIASGAIAPGDHLPSERDLMRRFKVSRSVVREAIAALANRGLLLTRPGYRPVVAKPSVDSAIAALGQFVGHMTILDEDGIWNLFETRMFIEAALVRRAALHARKDDIQELRAALALNRAVIGRRGEFERSDAEFHHVLYKIPRNPVYPAVHRAYVEWLYEHWLRIGSTPEIDMTHYAGHEAIFTAINERDPDRGEDALRSHLIAAWEYVRTTFVFAPGEASTGREDSGEIGTS